MPFTDRDHQRTYQAGWTRAKRARVRAEFFAGKACLRCGSVERLEIHHRDPAQKEDHRIWTWPEARRLAELAKCDVLCRPCHQAVHAAWKAARRRHGTTTMYRHGCRCHACSAAAVAYNRAYRERHAVPLLSVPAALPAARYARPLSRARIVTLSRGIPIWGGCPRQARD